MDANLAYKEDYREQRRMEMIDGKIFMMAPSASVNHHEISLNIAMIFRNYLRGKKCRAFGDGVDLYLTEKDRFIPDGMVVCDPDKIKRDGVHGAPDLVVEILSLSTAKNDKFRKKDVYEKCGVKEYWIVDQKNKWVEVYLLRDGRFTEGSVYPWYSPELLEELDEEERAQVVEEFQCSLFADLSIRLEEVFRLVE